MKLPLFGCCLGFRKRSRGRDDLHDPEPSQPEFRENGGKRFDGPLMDVVKNQETYMTDFIRDPRTGGCAVGKPPLNLGFRLVREFP